MTRERTTIHAARLWAGAGAPLVHDATLAIESGRITYAGPHRDAGGDWVDLGDVTLLPGLVDAHLHLADDGWLPLELLANGVTTVRDVGNNYLALLELRELQQRGEWTGPRIVTFGPLIDRRPAHWGHVAREVMPEDDVEAAVDELLNDGVDGLKLYVHVDPSVAERVIKHASERGAPVTIHGGTVMATRALEMGIGCVEHAGSLDVLPDGATWADFDPNHERFQRIVELFLSTGAHLCPTLTVMEGVEDGWQQEYLQRPGFERLPVHLRDHLASNIDTGSWTEERFAECAPRFRGMMEATGRLHAAGVPLLVGSDAPFVPPGQGLHTELAFLTECGVSCRDALTMATSGNARYLGLEDEIGALEVGKAADVVAVEGNPLADIRAMNNVSAVWQSGHRLDPAALAEQARSAAERMPPPPEGLPPWGIPSDEDWREDMRAGGNATDAAP